MAPRTPAGYRAVLNCITDCCRGVLKKRHDERTHCRVSVKLHGADGGLSRELMRGAHLKYRPTRLSCRAGAEARSPFARMAPGRRLRRPPSGAAG